MGKSCFGTFWPVQAVPAPRSHPGLLLLRILPAPGLLVCNPCVEWQLTNPPHRGLLPALLPEIRRQSRSRFWVRWSRRHHPASSALGTCMLTYAHTLRVPFLGEKAQRVISSFHGPLAFVYISTWGLYFVSFHIKEIPIIYHCVLPIKGLRCQWG